MILPKLHKSLRPFTIIVRHLQGGAVGSLLLDLVGSLLLATSMLSLPSGEAEELVAAECFVIPNSSTFIVLSPESAHVPIHPVLAVYISFLGS